MGQIINTAIYGDASSWDTIISTLVPNIVILIKTWGALEWWWTSFIRCVLRRGAKVRLGVLFIHCFISVSVKFCDADPTMQRLNTLSLQSYGYCAVSLENCLAMYRLSWYRETILIVKLYLIVINLCFPFLLNTLTNVFLIIKRECTWYPQLQTT